MRGLFFVLSALRNLFYKCHRLMSADAGSDRCYIGTLNLNRETND